MHLMIWSHIIKHKLIICPSFCITVSTLPLISFTFHCIFAFYCTYWPYQYNIVVSVVLSSIVLCSFISFVLCFMLHVGTWLNLSKLDLSKRTVTTWVDITRLIRVFFFAVNTSAFILPFVSFLVAKPHRLSTACH